MRWYRVTPDANAMIDDSQDRCDCCGGDGILNRDLPPEQQAPIWTEVRFWDADSGLSYFYRQVCTECNNRWQRMLMADEERSK